MNINSKLETLNSKQTLNPKLQTSRKYDLADRTFQFSKNIINYVKKLPRTISNLEISKQLIRSAGSVGSNYIEAEESLSKKDFLMRIKISKKEAKESRYWLGLSDSVAEEVKEKEELIREITELMKIFGSIVEKSK